MVLANMTCEIWRNAQFEGARREAGRRREIESSVEKLMAGGEAEEASWKENAAERC